MIRQTAISIAFGALLLSACGSSAADNADDGVASLDSVPEAQATADELGDADEPTEEDFEQAFEAYEQCAADLGLGDIFVGSEGDGASTEVVLESDDGSDVAVSDENFEEQLQRLEEECDPLLDAVSQDFELSPEQEAEFADAELAFARCMREAGFDFPDPGGDSDGGFVIEIESDDFDIDAMDQATGKCDDVFDDLSINEESEGS